MVRWIAGGGGQNSVTEMVVGMAHRADASNLRAVRSGLGAALRTNCSDVLREPIPEEMAELLRQLDRALESATKSTRRSHAEGQTNRKGPARGFAGSAE